MHFKCFSYKILTINHESVNSFHKNEHAFLSNSQRLFFWYWFCKTTKIQLQLNAGWLLHWQKATKFVLHLRILHLKKHFKSVTAQWRRVSEDGAGSARLLCVSLFFLLHQNASKQHFQKHRLPISIPHPPRRGPSSSATSLFSLTFPATFEKTVKVYARQIAKIFWNRTKYLP